MNEDNKQHPQFNQQDSLEKDHIEKEHIENEQIEQKEKQDEQETIDQTVTSSGSSFIEVTQDKPYQTEQEDKTESIQQKQHSNKKQSGNIKSALFGGVIGGVMSAVIIVVLLLFNLIPIQVKQDTPTSQQQNGQHAVTTIATDEEDNDISENGLTHASSAVVGVINLQQRSIWEASEEAGTGSGIIYKKENGKAYIVTNAHVVEDAQEVEVVLNNDERIQAKVLGSDSLSDLAVLQVDSKKINAVAKLGSSDQLNVGETVYAIGNPLGMEFANSLTKGIVSGLNRSISVDTTGDGQPDWITEVIQTDAAINPGNSGGALVNKNGNVIGINSMKIARSEVEGIGFAIPIDAAMPLMEQLETNGEVERPFIGIASAPLSQVPTQYRQQISLPDEVKGGMVIASVEPGSPAEQAGLKQYDVITKINGNDITSILELRKFLYTEASINDTLHIEIYRNGKQHTIDLKLTKKKADQ